MERVAGGGRRLSVDEALRLWTEYRETGDARVRDRLVFTFSPMVKYIVDEKVRKIRLHCEVEDLISRGLEALVRSIERYDPARGRTLEEYAWVNIKHAVIDELRVGDWAPRPLRRMEREVAQARARFAVEHGRPPTRAELSDALGVTDRELRDHEGRVARAQLSSLNTPLYGEDGAMVEAIDTLESDHGECDPEQSAMRGAAKARLREAIEGLSERERRIVVLRYVKELPLHEIGEILGVKKARVCQLDGEIRRKLRADLRGTEQLLAALA